MPSLNRFFIVLLAGLLCGLSAGGLAQSLGNAGTVSGVVSDPNGAVSQARRSSFKVGSRGTGAQRPPTRRGRSASPAFRRIIIN